MQTVKSKDTEKEKLLIGPIGQTHKIQNLKMRKDVILGDPNDLVDISWEKEINNLNTFPTGCVVTSS